MKKRGIKDHNLIWITLLACVYGVIYAIRMFTNMPWYDELYTYYSFISRGPVYAAIHWPLPNNHVGYSALSGFLSYFGNATIALRGVSFLCATINIVLVYYLARKLVDNKAAYICVFLYASVFLVHNMAVQGRGYTLSTTCYIVSLLMLYRICFDLGGKKEYVIYSLCLAMGIYAVPSSTFWVLPVCIFGGIFLLCNGKGKSLLKLIASSLVAAALCLFLYLTIWLSIGSNLLLKEGDPAFAGGHINIILHHPAAAAKRGLDYMLASPYIQSMDSATVKKELFIYLENLFDQYYSGAGRVLTIFFAVTAVVAIIRFIIDRSRFLELFLAVSVVMLPVMLIVQSVQPYLRVFSYFGLVMALGMVMYIDIFVTRFITGYSKVYTLLVIASGAALVGLLFTYRYTAPMADREADIADALSLMESEGVSVSDIDSMYYTDDYQKYVIKFIYDRDIPELAMGEAGFVMVSDTLKDESIDHTDWPMLSNSKDFDFELLNSEYEEISGTDRYAIYRKRK